MKQFLIATLFLLPVAGQAAEKAEVLALFNEYVETCTADPGDDGPEACLTDQVDSVDNYLGDIVGEMTGYVSESAGKLMLDGHKAFEKYRYLTCTYEQEAHPEDPRAGLFCFLRLTEQRRIDVQEGLSFATTTLD